MNRLKRFLKKKFGKPQEIRTEINPELLERDREYQHLAKAYAYEKGRRVKAEETLGELTKVKEDNREEVARLLTEQKEEILRKEVGIATSIKNILRVKGKKSIKVVSYNRERDFGILRDIGISQNGLMSVYVYDIDRPIMTGRNPQEIFRNCAGLRNDANKGIIAINLDSNGDYVENLEQIEVPDVIIDFNRQIKVLNHDTKPFIERIIEKNNEIDDLFHEIKVNERTISEITKELNEEKKKNEVLGQENKSYKFGISDVLERIKEIQANYNRLTKNMSILESENVLLEEFKERTDTILENLHKKLSDKEGRTVIDNAIGELKNNLEWYEEMQKNRPITPQQIVVETSEKEQKPLPQPVKV